MCDLEGMHMTDCEQELLYVVTSFWFIEPGLFPSKIGHVFFHVETIDVLHYEVDFLVHVSITQIYAMKMDNIRVVQCLQYS